MKTAIAFLSLGFLSVIDAIRVPHEQIDKNQADAHQHNILDGSLKRICGSPPKSEVQRIEIDKAISEHMRENRSYNLKEGADIEIEVYWNALHNSNGDGYYPDSVVEEQIKILNDAFSGTESSYSECTGAGRTFTYEDNMPSSPFKFVLKNINRVKSDDEFDLDSEDSKFYREGARRGDCSALNIFTGGSAYLGLASFPDDCPLEGNSKTPFVGDAVMLNYLTLPGLPGGGEPPYDEGDTATHEVGHWLGLYHTFQGACSNRGDRVSDTASEQDSTYGCPVGKSSCGGEDPIHNFMDYSDDCCMYRFTTQQVTRMVSSFSTFRSKDTTVVNKPCKNKWKWKKCYKKERKGRCASSKKTRNNCKKTCRVCSDDEQWAQLIE